MSHDLVIFALSVAFFSGIYVTVLRVTRKELNGLGGRLNRVDKKHEERIDRVVMAMTHICPNEQREELIRIILGGGKGA